MITTRAPDGAKKTQHSVLAALPKYMSTKIMTVMCIRCHFIKYTSSKNDTDVYKNFATRNYISIKLKKNTWHNESTTNFI